MSEKQRFTTAQVSRYLLDRLRDGSNGKGKNAKKGRVAGLRRGTLDDALACERLVFELSSLATEKQDLVRQLCADGEAGESACQDDLLEVLGRTEAGKEDSFRGLLGRFDMNMSTASARQEARRRLKEVDERIKAILADPRMFEAYRTRVEKRVSAIRLARNVESLERIAERCELGTMRLTARRSSLDLCLTSADLESMRKADSIAGQCRQQMERLMSREDVYYEVKRRGLLEYRRQLMSGGFVRTASVRREIVRVLSHLHLGIPVFLRGHLGVGKTELALHVCRTYFGGEPEFISGSEEATKYDIYGRTQIGVGSERERVEEFKRRMEEFERIYPNAGQKELKEAQRQYYETIVVKGQTTSFFQYGPLARAMMEGRPLIIDEMDGIPHSILMRINHVLTRKAGDKVKIQESGGEEILIKPGFCVLATGNVKSARYKREELDAAFLSRWWSEDITYPPREETYEILLASLVDRRGSLQVRNQTDLEDLKRLTEAASEIQRIFTGEHLDFLGEGADAARGIAASLRKSVLSLRNLWNIVRPWKAHNFDKPLEYYILNEFIRPAVAEDQVYLIQLFCRFRFFKDWGVGAFEIPGLTEPKLLAFQGRQARP